MKQDIKFSNNYIEIPYESGLYKFLNKTSYMYIDVIQDDEVYALENAIEKHTYNKFFNLKFISQFENKDYKFKFVLFRINRKHSKFIQQVLDDFDKDLTIKYGQEYIKFKQDIVSVVWTRVLACL